MGKPVYLLELTALAWLQYMRSGVPNTQGSFMVNRTRFTFNAARTYRITAVCRKADGANGTLYVGPAFYDASGNYIGTLDAIAAADPSPPTSWTTYSTTFGASTGNPFPSGAVTVVSHVALNYGGTTGTHDCKALWIEDTTAAGVAVTQDRGMRSAEEWEAFAGTAPSFLTSMNDAVDTLTLRYATAAYITASYDTPAKTQYDVRVRQPGLLRYELPNGPGGCTTTSYGQIVLDNSDGALGALAYYGLDGQAFRLLSGQDDAALGTFTEVMRGTMQQATVDRKQVTIRLAGRDAGFDLPVCRSRYLGNNALPNGLEGSSELAGQPKPRIFGGVYGIAPPCVNTTRRIYHVGDSINGAAITNVWDAGVALTGGANYSSQADMETNAPAAGGFRAWPAGGYFRLGSVPTGVVTCAADATETSYGGDFWWNLLYRLAQEIGLVSGDYEFNIGTGFARPDNWGGTWGGWPAGQPPMGLWVNDARTTLRQAMNQVASSAGAWCGFVHWYGAPSNSMRFGGALFPPTISGLSVSTSPAFDASNLLAVAAVADPGEGRGVPAYSVELGYVQNYTVYTPNMAPTVNPLALGRLAMKNSRALSTDAAVLVKNPNARAVVRDTAFNDNPTEVGYESRRQLEAQRYTKLWFEVRASLRAVLDMTYRPQLGGCVYLSWPQLQVLWQDGVTRSAGWFVVMALEIDFARNEMRLTLRQATEQSI